MSTIDGVRLDNTGAVVPAGGRRISRVDGWALADAGAAVVLGRLCASVLGPGF
jgi:hypothetical protein